jgi:autotransporter-associated beta strand protein
MQRSKRAIVIAAASAAFAQFSALSFHANAATFTWSGLGTDDNLTTGANWVGNVAPTLATDVAQFSTATAPRITPSTGAGVVQYGSLSFLAGSPAFNIGGSNTLTLGASTTAVVLQNSDVGVNQTFGAPVSIAGGTINMAAGGFVFNGPINIGNGTNAAANNVTILGASTVSFAGGLSAGGSSLNFGSGGSGNDAAANFTGTALLSTDNSGYTGQMFINGGTVVISNGNALGSGTVTTQLSSGGTGKGALALTGGITVNTNVVTRARDTGTIMLENVSGNNTINNVFTNTGGSTFNYDSTSGTLTITNWTTTATGGNRIVNLSGAGNGVISNWNAASGATLTLNKSGAGQWTLGTNLTASVGSFANTSVTGGTLTFGANLGAKMFGSATISNGGAIEDVSGDGTTGEIGNGITPTTIAINAGGTLDASSFTQYNLQVSQTFIGGGTVKVGQIGFFGDSSVYVGNTAASASIGTLSIVGSASLTNLFTGGTATQGFHFDLGTLTTEGSGISDVVTVSGNLTLDTSGGQIPIYINPVGGPLATGSYTLFDVGGSITGDSHTAFINVGGGAGTTRQSFDIENVGKQVDLIVSGSPANLTWKGDGSGNNWDVVGSPNWKSAAVTDPTHFYNFDQVTFTDNTANTTVNLNTTVTPSSITATTAQTYSIVGSGTITGAATLTKSGPGTFILANTGTNGFTGAITINAGTLQIGDGGADGSIGSGSVSNSGALVFNTSIANTLPQIVSGTGLLANKGTGTLVVSGSNTFTGPVAVQGGQLIIGNASALGDLTGNTTVSSGAELALNSALTMNEAVTINGLGIGTIGGALHSGGATSSTWAGAITMASDAALKVDGGATMNVTAPITGSNTNLTLNADAGGNGIIAGTINIGAGGITKAGPGQWTLTNASNVYSGPTTVSAGVLQFGNGTATGITVLPGAVATVAGGTVAFNNNGSYAVNTTITGAGAVAVGNGGGTATLTGNLTGFTGTLATLSSSTTSPNSTLVVPVATGATGIFISDVNLTGVGQGIIRLTNSNAVVSGATLESDVSQAAGTGRLELGNSVNLNMGTVILHPRTNATPTVLATDGNDMFNTLSGTMRIENGGSTVNFQASAGATLTVTGGIHPASATEAPATAPGSSRVLALTGAGDGTFAGSVTNRPDATTTVGIIVIKAGSGTWRLTGTNDYIGDVGNTLFQTNVATIVQNGTLDLVGSGAQAPVLANTNTAAFTDVQGGRLSFDYTGNPTLGPQLNGLLATSFNSTGGFNNTTALIRSTTSTGTLGLGMIDNQTTHVATIGFTVFGDANLDGTVNLLDVNAVATNFGTTTGALWYQGDNNYDGQVNILDFNRLAANFAMSAPIPTAGQALPGGVALGTLVPEPASLGLIGAASAVMLSGRRRRNHRV